MLIVWGIFFQSVDLAKVISFTDERPEGSGAKLDSESRRYEEGDFTICLDKYITSINCFINLVFSDDFTLSIPMHKIN